MPNGRAIPALKKGEKKKNRKRKRKKNGEGRRRRKRGKRRVEGPFVVPL